MREEILMAEQILQQEGIRTDKECKIGKYKK